jgi:hypothetical protein
LAIGLRAGLEVFHNATPVWSRLKLWNESGTNRARIGASSPLRLRSPQHVALTPDDGTRSSLAQLDKGGFGGKFLKVVEAAESNQK